MKISQFPQDYVLESCHPNPCNNNGKCVSIESEKRCECADHFTGSFDAIIFQLILDVTITIIT